MGSWLMLRSDVVNISKSLIKGDTLGNSGKVVES